MDMVQWLIANPGSTSRKYAIYRDEKQVAFIVFRESDQYIEFNIRTDILDKQGKLKNLTLKSAIAEMPGLVQRETGIEISPDAVALRIVAYGEMYQQHQWLDQEILSVLEKQKYFFPLHIPIILSEFSKLTETFPDTPVLGVSDSAFHARHTSPISSYGLDLKLSEKYEAKRYGYHGLASASAAAFLAENQSAKNSKAIHAHLGGGTSITAMIDGKSVYTSMGHTPLEGPIMMSRSGTLDPSLTAVLAGDFDSSAALIKHLSRSCGIGALTGTTDMRKIENQYHNGKNAAIQAIEKYVSDVSGFIGTAIMHLEGIDYFIISGGIGENSTLVRNKIVKKLEFFNLKQVSNSENPDSDHQILTTKDSAIKAILLKINEEEQMAGILKEYFNKK